MAMEILFKSDIGLLSLFTIAFMLVMAVFLFFWGRKQMVKDEERARRRAAKHKQAAAEAGK